MHTEFCVQTLGLIRLGFIKIHNIPSLSLGAVVAPNLHWVSFNVFPSSNIKDLAVGPVDELVALILEDLEPS